MRRLQYINDMMVDRSRIGEINTATRRDCVEGREKGGVEEKIAIAKKALAMGTDHETVQRVTGLSED